MVHRISVYVCSVLFFQSFDVFLIQLLSVDQNYALQWVQKYVRASNINFVQSCTNPRCRFRSSLDFHVFYLLKVSHSKRKFGGDPTQVTIWGESGGSIPIT